MKNRHSHYMGYIALIILALPLSSCALLQRSALIRPEVKIERFDIEAISLRDIRLGIDLGVTNPYPIDVRFERISAKLLIEKNQFFNTNTRRGLKIAPGKKERVSFIVNLKFADIWKIVHQYSEKDYLESEISGDVVLGLLKTGVQGAKFLDSLSIPFQWRVKIPAMKPEIRIVNFAVEMPARGQVVDAIRKGEGVHSVDAVMSSLSDVLAGKKSTGRNASARLEIELPVILDIELKNNAKTRILVQDMHYDFFVNGESLIRGETGEIVTNGNTFMVKIRNTIRLRSLSESLIKALKQGKGNYALKGYSHIRFPEAIKKDPLRLALDEKGGFSF